MITGYSAELEVDCVVDVDDYIMFGEWTGINDDGLSYAVNTACFMDMTA